MDMGRYPAWSALLDQALDRPAVQRALYREGLSAGEFRPA